VEAAQLATHETNLWSITPLTGSTYINLIRGGGNATFRQVPQPTGDRSKWLSVRTPRWLSVEATTGLCTCLTGKVGLPCTSCAIATKVWSKQ
jgi:hypothetical protein